MWIILSYWDSGDIESGPCSVSLLTKARYENVFCLLTEFSVFFPEVAVKESVSGLRVPLNLISRNRARDLHIKLLVKCWTRAPVLKWMEIEIVCTLYLRLSLPLSLHATASQALILALGDLYVQSLNFFFSFQIFKCVGKVVTSAVSSWKLD